MALNLKDFTFSTHGLYTYTSAGWSTKEIAEEWVKDSIKARNTLAYLEEVLKETDPAEIVRKYNRNQMIKERITKKIAFLESGTLIEVDEADFVIHDVEKLNLTAERMETQLDSLKNIIEGLMDEGIIT